MLKSFIDTLGYSNAQGIPPFMGDFTHESMADLSSLPSLVKI